MLVLVVDEIAITETSFEQIKEMMIEKLTITILKEIRDIIVISSIDTINVVV